jgi:hypothetical protein
MSAPCSTPSFHLREQNNNVTDIDAQYISQTMMRDVLPWRTFRWYLGQRHYSGSYWASTESAHVIYESRLELSRLLMADFDPLVTRIVAQPFLMKAMVGDKVRRHIPDYWLLTEEGPVVVDVKPQARLDDPDVVATFVWVRKVVESAGWRFEVVSEQPPAKLENVRFLAGYRHAHGISQAALAELRSIDLDGVSFADAIRRASGPSPLIRAGLLHMLWTHQLTADLSEVLCSETILHAGTPA